MPIEDAVGVIPVFFQCLPLLGKDGNSRFSNCCGRMVLRRKYVATCPSDIGSKVFERLDKHGSLYGHVERSGDARPL